MCGGGGGDGGAKDAQEAEEARQTKINESIGRINKYYDGIVDPHGTLTGEAQDKVDNLTLLLEKARAGTDFVIGNQLVGTPWGGGSKDIIEHRIDNNEIARLEDELRDAGSQKNYVEGTVHRTQGDDIYDATFDINNRKLQELFRDASLQDKFTAARAGNLTGSADLDRRSKRRTERDEGALKAGQVANNAKLGYVSKLNNERANLIAQAQAGLSGTDGVKLAAQHQQNAAESATNESVSANLGQVFSNIGAGYTQGQQQVGRGKYQGAYFNNTGTGGRVT